MKAKVLTKTLQEVIKKVSKLKVKSSLPILNNTLLIAKNGQLTLINSDLEIALKISITDCEIEEEGLIVINPKDLNLITKIKENYITIENDKIITDKKNLKIVTLDAEEYPKLQECSNSKWTTSKDDIKHLLEVTYATAPDETRPILTGIFIDKNKWVAIDGYRLSVREGKYNSDVSIVVKGKQVELLSKLMDKNTKNIEFLTDEKNMYSSFKFDNVEIISRILEGDFVRYNQIIPEGRETYMKVNKDELIEELTFAKEIVKNKKGYPVKLINNFDDNELILNCTADENILNTKIKTNDTRNIDLDNNFTIGFNPKYLEEALKSHVNDEELYIIYGYSNSGPAIITSEVSSNNIDLVLPVRIKA